MTYIRDGLRYRSEEWADSIQIVDGGWSEFQFQCKRSLVKELGTELSPGKVGRTSVQGESVFEGIIPGSCRRFWIYVDGAQIEGLGTLEHWDFTSPAHLISEFVQQVSRELQSNKSLNSDAGKAGAG
ncbi:MAG: hypothetical protein U5L08_00790 [Xanthomonadales bacterium]|nr:hypothetical protein [Xanthomonadales bacterium]